MDRTIRKLRRGSSSCLTGAERNTDEDDGTEASNLRHAVPPANNDQCSSTSSFDKETEIPTNTEDADDESEDLGYEAGESNNEWEDMGDCEVVPHDDNLESSSLYSISESATEIHDPRLEGKDEMKASLSSGSVYVCSRQQDIKEKEEFPSRKRGRQSDETTSSGTERKDPVPEELDRMKSKSKYKNLKHMKKRLNLSTSVTGKPLSEEHKAGCPAPQGTLKGREFSSRKRGRNSGERTTSSSSAESVLLERDRKIGKTKKKWKKPPKKRPKLSSSLTDEPVRDEHQSCCTAPHGTLKGKKFSLSKPGGKFGEKTTSSSSAESVPVKRYRRKYKTTKKWKKPTKERHTMSSSLNDKLDQSEKICYPKKEGVKEICGKRSYWRSRTYLYKGRQSDVKYFYTCDLSFKGSSRQQDLIAGDPSSKVTDGSSSIGDYLSSEEHTEIGSPDQKVNHEGKHDETASSRQQDLIPGDPSSKVIDPSDGSSSIGDYLSSEEHTEIGSPDQKVNHEGKHGGTAFSVHQDLITVDPAHENNVPELDDMKSPITVDRRLTIMCDSEECCIRQPDVIMGDSAYESNALESDKIKSPCTSFTAGFKSEMISHEDVFVGYSEDKNKKKSIDKLSGESGEKPSVQLVSLSDSNKQDPQQEKSPARDESTSASGSTSHDPSDAPPYISSADESSYTDEQGEGEDETFSGSDTQGSYEEEALAGDESSSHSGSSQSNHSSSDERVHQDVLDEGEDDDAASLRQQDLIVGDPGHEEESPMPYVELDTMPDGDHYILVNVIEACCDTIPPAQEQLKEPFKSGLLAIKRIRRFPRVSYKTPKPERICTKVHADRETNKLVVDKRKGGTNFIRTSHRRNKLRRLLKEVKSHPELYARVQGIIIRHLHDSSRGSEETVRLAAPLTPDLDTKAVEEKKPDVDSTPFLTAASKKCKSIFEKMQSLARWARRGMLHRKFYRWQYRLDRKRRLRLKHRGQGCLREAKAKSAVEELKLCMETKEATFEIYTSDSAFGEVKKNPATIEVNPTEVLEVEPEHIQVITSDMLEIEPATVEVTTSDPVEIKPGKINARKEKLDVRRKFCKASKLMALDSKRKKRFRQRHNIPRGSSIRNYNIFRCSKQVKSYVEESDPAIHNVPTSDTAEIKSHTAEVKPAIIGDPTSGTAEIKPAIIGDPSSDTTEIKSVIIGDPTSDTREITPTSVEVPTRDAPEIKFAILEVPTPEEAQIKSAIIGDPTTHVAENKSAVIGDHTSNMAEIKSAIIGDPSSDTAEIKTVIIGDPSSDTAEIKTVIIGDPTSDTTEIKSVIIGDSKYDTAEITPTFVEVPTPDAAEIKSANLEVSTSDTAEIKSAISEVPTSDTAETTRTTIEVPKLETAKITPTTVEFRKPDEVEIEQSATAEMTSELPAEEIP